MLGRTDGSRRREAPGSPFSAQQELPTRRRLAELGRGDATGLPGGDQGYVDEAIAILRGLADAGDPMAEYQLAKLRPAVDEWRAAGNGVDDRADRGDINAALSLANSLACTGDFDETLPILHTLVDRGIPESGDQLTATFVELGRSQEAYRLARFGLTADGRIENLPARPLFRPCGQQITHLRRDLWSPGPRSCSSPRPSCAAATGMAPTVGLMEIRIASDLVGDTGIEPVTSSV
jgi:hypothetical protein